MILRTMAVVGTVLMTGLGFSSGSKATELDGGYLLGTWVVDTTDCASTAAEFVVFRKSGAFESLRAGRLEAAGFWALEGDLVKMNLVASPAFFQDAKEQFAKLGELGGGFSTFEIRVIPLNLQQDKFDAVGVLEDQVAVTAFQRCESMPPS